MIKIYNRNLNLYWIFFLGITVFFVACGGQPSKQNYFPETGPDALFQRSLDLQSNLNVLSIALEPGYEDLPALAYFRLGRGAKIMSAYLTNGNAGESDLRDDYPHYIAATRRIEASRALAYLNGDVHFLNFPAVIAARDTEKIRKLWPATEVRKKVRSLMNQFKPDIILIARDWAARGKSLRFALLREDVLAAVEHSELADGVRADEATSEQGDWTPGRVFVDDPQQKGISLPVGNKHPRFKKKYRRIGEEAATEYQSLQLQRKMWQKGKEPSYSLVFPARDAKLAGIDTEPPKKIGASLQFLDGEIQRLTQKTLKGKTADALPLIVTLLDSVNYRLVRRHKLSPADYRLLLHWKGSLDRLRCTILGVKVKYTISDTALTELQLTYIRVQSVTGLESRGKTEIYFGGLEQGWAVNEGFAKRLPLKLNEPYRLLTPRRIAFTTPQAIYGLKNARVDKPIMFFIIHRSPDREKSFIHRSDIKLSFAPRFLTEVLTPIVRIVPDERLAVRLKNFSRDGVADTLKITGDLASSMGGAFRLSQKEATYMDTLFIIWKDGIKNGSYVVPLEINGIKVGQFAARKFDLQVDRSKKVGVISGARNSILFETLRRMDIKASYIQFRGDFQKQADSLDVLIVDRRALTLKPELKKYRKKLGDFVNRGGHLIIMAQDAEVWNNHPLWPGVHLSASQSLDESTPVVVNAEHPFLSSPNKISAADWENWLYLRAHNIVTGKAVNQAEIPIRAGNRSAPLLLTKKQKLGRVTYIDLALKPQLFNIHAGAFRLLANIISANKGVNYEKN